MEELRPELHARKKKRKIGSIDGMDREDQTPGQTDVLDQAVGLILHHRCHFEEGSGGKLHSDDDAGVFSVLASVIELQRAFRGIVGDFARRGRAVLFSSHVLSEVAAVCDRVAILRDGAVVALERVEGLREKAAELEDIFLRYYLQERRDG